MDESKPKLKKTAVAAEPAPDIGAPKYPRLRKLFELFAAVAIGVLGAKFGIPVAGDAPAATQPAPEQFAGELDEFPVMCPQRADGEGPAIAGKTEYPAHSLVRLKAVGVKPGAAVLWRVSPRAGVERATTKGDILEFAAVPGSYDVELLVIAKDGDGFSTEEVFTKVTIGAPPKTDPKVDPKKEPETKADPVKALGRVQFGNSSCTATVVSPRRSDGRWDVLCASHCMAGVGAKGTLHTKDGRKLPVRVVVHDERPDVAWLVTEDAVEGLAFADVAATNPAAGVKVWHAGYGVDVPNNREDGEVLYSEQPDGKTTFHLSVSPGDSGGGIFRSDTGELVGTVCCTSKLAEKARMSAGGVAALRKLRPGVVRLDELPEPEPADLPRCRLHTFRWMAGAAW